MVVIDSLGGLSEPPSHEDTVERGAGRRHDARMTKKSERVQWVWSVCPSLEADIGVKRACSGCFPGMVMDTTAFRSGVDA